MDLSKHKCNCYRLITTQLNWNYRAISIYDCLIYVSGKNMPSHFNWAAFSNVKFYLLNLYYNNNNNNKNIIIK